MRILPISVVSLLVSVCLLPSVGALHVEIDKAIGAGADGPFAPKVSDGEFLRRVYLDFAGRIPTIVEARQFLADKNPEKRSKRIDALIAAPEFPGRMEQVVTVMLLERRYGGKIPEQKWREWLRGQFAANRPWNEIVHELLASEGDATTTPAAKFMVNDEKFDSQKVAHDVARLFLGMNLGCAQCHDHPTVKGFLQADYYGIYAYLAQTDMKPDKATKKVVLSETPTTARIEFKSVFKPDKFSTAPHVPGGQEVVLPTFAPGEEYEVKPDKAGTLGVPKFPLRPRLARDLTTDGNRRFAQNSVNRFWWLLMGRGLVHPLDMMHSENPPSHPELLELLASEFIAHKFDVRWLLREIAHTDTYQRASRAPNGTDLKSVKPESYRVANLRPLSAEQVGVASMVATGSWELLERESSNGKAESAEPAGKKKKPVANARAYLTGKVTELPTSREDSLEIFVAAFAGPAGEPEVDFTPSMAHSLFLMNERMVLDWLKPKENNLMARLAKLTSPAEVADELYLSVLTRQPEKEEVAEVEDFLKKNESRREGALGELAWALLASAEFRLNH
jgi:hypothetical protein